MAENRGGLDLSNNLTTSSSSSSQNQNMSSTSNNSSLEIFRPPSKTPSMEPKKRCPDDYIFGRLIGEGSFSSVFLAKEIDSGNEYAIKVCDKRHIIKEKKQTYIHSEKKILLKIAKNWKETVPFFVNIRATFQDTNRLYFVMTYAKNGDLLNLINSLEDKDIEFNRFYAGQLLVAVEYLHKLNIIHRDLKPENILLNEKMQILITDFGSAKLLDEDGDNDDRQEPLPKRKSFVGTPQYVSPEILTGRFSSRASDLWAIGCILYQMLTELPPFQSQSEYLIFQKIQQLEYSFHEGFDENAKDLIQKLLVIEPSNRIGANDANYYQSIRNHPFFKGLNFESLHQTAPPCVASYVTKEYKQDRVWEDNPNMVPGARRIPRLMLEEDEHFNDSNLDEVLQKSSINEHILEEQKKRNIVNLTDEERLELLQDQEKNNKFHRFVEGNLIIKQGILDKKKGLWARRRMFLLTEGPHLYYVDPDNMVLKGEIPWSSTIRPEVRDFKIFCVHTPNRVYYLISPDATAKSWCNAIQEVRKFYYGDN